MSREPPELPYGVRMIVAYDGTDFHGWQRQDGYRTVQGELEAAALKLGLKTSVMRGASRTDAGVHAEGQVVACACDRELPEAAWTVGLNGLLPDDIAVKEARAAHRLYNPRFDSEKKLYRYLVSARNTRDPLMRERVWHLGPRFARRDRRDREDRVDEFFDVEVMREAAAAMLGTFDFRAFRSSSDERSNTKRTMTRVDVLAPWAGREDLLAIEVEGDAFMKNMVRIIAGTLVDIGRQHLPVGTIATMLSDEGGRDDGGATAPPQGLTLVRIWPLRGDHPRAFR